MPIQDQNCAEATCFDLVSRATILSETELHHEIHVLIKIVCFHIAKGLEVYDDPC